MTTYLAVAAHPDDLDFGCAGTTASLTAAGDRVVYCLVTDGQAGGFDNTITRAEMAEIRRKEQTAAAAVVGVTELHWLGFPDGAVEAGLPLRKAITRVIREVKPDVVITQSPDRNYARRIFGSHPDHRAVGDSTLDAVYPDSRNEFAFPELLADEGLEPHTVAETWLIGGPRADHAVDITAFMEAKIEALLCHESQMQAPDEMPEMLRTWAREQAEASGLDEGRYAERFRRLQTA
ncbi:MAG: PIG-L deacetylase family protein [Actinomycetota bacterium]